MILELKTITGKTVNARGHRIFKNTYPNIALFIHYALAEDENGIDTNEYSISTVDGTCVYRGEFSDIRLFAVYATKWGYV